LDAGRAHVLYNGIDAAAFRPVAKTGYLHAELGLPPSVPLVATIGQITLRKGHDLFVAAALQTAATLPQVHWLVVGERYSEKPETVAFDRQLRHRAAANGMGDRIHWLGYRDDVRRMLPEIDLLVHPARQEPLGRVLLEAAAAAVPIIATDVGGTAEIIDDKRSGLLVPPEDSQAIAVAVTDLLNDPPYRASLARTARESITRRFDLTTQATQLADVWRGLT
jgi:glycosyltransferase involved in cell wall biosynthesis